MLQLIVPSHNEQARLPATLTELRAWANAARDGGGPPIEVIVVDNASTDATASVAAAHSSPALPVQVVQCDVLGKGAAVRTGIMASTAPIIGYMDADGATHFDALRDGLDLLASGADLVLGSRVVEGSSYHGRSNPVRILGAHVYRRLHPDRARHPRHPVRLQADARRPGPAGAPRHPGRPASPSTSR